MTCPTCGDAGEIPVGPPHHLVDCDCAWDETPCAQTFKPCPDCRKRNPITTEPLRETDP